MHYDKILQSLNLSLWLRFQRYIIYRNLIIDAIVQHVLSWATIGLAVRRVKSVPIQQLYSEEAYSACSEVEPVVVTHKSHRLGSV